MIFLGALIKHHVDSNIFLDDELMYLANVGNLRKILGTLTVNYIPDHIGFELEYLSKLEQVYETDLVRKIFCKEFLHFILTQGNGIRGTTFENAAWITFDLMSNSLVN